MDEPVAAPDRPVRAGEVAGSPARRRAWTVARLPRGSADGLAAVVAWLVCLPLAILLAAALDLDPFTVAGDVMPFAVGCCAAIVLLTWVLRRPSALVVGVGAGVYAGWMALTMAAALRGTPYGYGLLSGDEGRLLAMATKYMTTVRPVDGFVHNLPTEYPPLFPWVVGHVAHLLGRPAWRIEGDAQIVLMSGAFVLGYLLWRRLVAAPTAFLIVALSPAGAAEPSKAYEFVTALVIVPWIIATFTGRPRERGGMHWLPAGIIGGLIVATYSAYLVFSMLGILALVVLAWREAARRRALLLHLVGVVVTAFVVASWYVVPFLVTYITKGGERLSDLFLSVDLVTQPVPLGFTEATPFGLIQLVGLFGMVWYRRSTWWARPMLLVTGSALAYRLLFLLSTVHNDHTGYAYYTTRLLDVVLGTAGILTISELVPTLRARVSWPLVRQRELAVLGVAIVVAWTSLQGWQQWMPGPRGARDAHNSVGLPTLSTTAHSEPLPGGGLPRYATPGVKPSVFPSLQVQRAIEATLGRSARPVVLSVDQRLFVFAPYYGYLPTDRLAANTLQKWDERYGEVRALAAITDPAQFATAAAHTKFGPIDVFVLHVSKGSWKWRDVTFSPDLFSSQDFRITQLKPSTVVAVRVAG